MVSSINFYLSSLADIYSHNSINLSKTLQRLASGKKFLTPSDDLSSYFRSQSLNQQYQKYDRIRPEIKEWQGVMELASTAGGEVYNSLNRLKELSSMYDSADASTQAQYTNEYNQIVADLSKTVNTTYYDGISLLNQSNAPPALPADPLPRLKAIDLVPDPADDTQRMLIAPGEAVTAAHITALTPGAGENIGDVADHIATAMTDVKTFLGNVSAYSTGLQSHLNITDSIMENTASARSTITDIDQMQEMITFTQQDIRSQTSIAMMAQANLSQRSMLFLYGMHTG
jgi:flagellin